MRAAVVLAAFALFASAFACDDALTLIEQAEGYRCAPVGMPAAPLRLHGSLR